MGFRDEFVGGRGALVVFLLGSYSAVPQTNSVSDIADAGSEGCTQGVPEPPNQLLRTRQLQASSISQWAPA